MKIITKKQVEETIEVEIKTPSFYIDYGVYYSVTSQGLLIISKSSICHYTEDEHLFVSNIEDIVKHKDEHRYKEISESEFNEKFAATIENIGLLAGISNVPTLQLQEA